MAELKLKVDTGSVLVPVENERGEQIGEFYFNPLDSNMAKRYDDVIEFFNTFKVDESKDSFEEIKRLSEEVEKQFDYLFGYNVSEGIFGKCGVFTLLADGFFYYENVIEGIGNLIEQVGEQRVKKLKKRAREAASKYHK